MIQAGFRDGRIWEELEPDPGDVAIHKPSCGAFYDTPLETILKNLGRDAADHGARNTGGPTSGLADLRPNAANVERVTWMRWWGSPSRSSLHRATNGR